MVAIVELKAVREPLASGNIEPPPVQKMVAQAEVFQRLISSGSVKNRAELARRHGVTRARVTQLMNLLELHSDVLAYVRSLPSNMTPRLVTERQLRRLIRIPLEQQIDAALNLLPGFADFIGFTSSTSHLH